MGVSHKNLQTAYHEALFNQLACLHSSMNACVPYTTDMFISVPQGDLG